MLLDGVVTVTASHTPTAGLGVELVKLAAIYIDDPSSQTERTPQPDPRSVLLSGNRRGESDHHQRL
eukprot:180526-Rhodomonas_salina.1